MAGRVARIGGLAVAVVAALGGDAAAQGVCTPIARVSGDAELVRVVEDVLRERGLAVDGDGDCGEVAAVVDEAADHGVRVVITDGDGRVVERVAADAEGAATAIESWTRRDVADPLLAVRVAAVTTAATTVAAMAAVRLDDAEQPGAATSAAATAVSGDADTSGRRRIELAAGIDGGVSGDGGVWRGWRGQGCVRIGAVCAGFLARYSEDLRQGGDAVQLGTERDVLDLVATVELPLQRGRVTVAPAAGIGHTSVSAEREHLGTEVNDEFVESSALLLRGGVAASVRLSARWSLRGDLTAGYAPFAETELGSPEADRPAIAGIPRFMTWLGLGLSFGGL